jgi:hypothetical protein
MPKITLTDIQDAADRKYGPFIIEMPDGSEVALRSLLRLPGKKRGELLRKAEQLKDARALMEADPDMDFAAMIEDTLRILAPTKTAADKLIKVCDHDVAVLMEVFLGYMEASQPGEAQSSES